LPSNACQARNCIDSESDGAADPFATNNRIWIIQPNFRASGDQLRFWQYRATSSKETDMAKKKTAKKRTVKKRAPAKKAIAKKKSVRKVGNGLSKRKRSTKTALPSKKKRKTTKPRRRRLKPTERLEKMNIGIEQGEAGNLIVTESGGGAIQVHHTVHQGELVTPIPGKSYADLKALGPGNHEIEVVRAIELPRTTSART